MLACIYMCTMEGVYMFMTEDRLWGFVLSLQHVGPGRELMSSRLMAGCLPFSLELQIKGQTLSSPLQWTELSGFREGTV